MTASLHSANADHASRDSWVFWGAVLQKTAIGVRTDPIANVILYAFKRN